MLNIWYIDIIYQCDVEGLWIIVSYNLKSVFDSSFPSSRTVCVITYSSEYEVLQVSLGFYES